MCPLLSTASCPAALGLLCPVSGSSTTGERGRWLCWAAPVPGVTGHAAADVVSGHTVGCLCPCAYPKGPCSVSSPSAPSAAREGGRHGGTRERAALPGAAGRPEHLGAVLCSRAASAAAQTSRASPSGPVRVLRGFAPSFWLALSQACFLPSLPAPLKPQTVCFSPGGSLWWLWGGA